MKNLYFILLLVVIVCFNAVSAADYKASLFGVKSDGITLNTRSIQKAIDFISEKGGGRLVFYVGRYLTGTLQLKSNVTIQLEEGAVLVGTTSVYDYFPVKGTKALISAAGQQNIGITGKGVIDGQGGFLSEQIQIQIQKGYLKESMAQASPSLIAMDSCKNITFQDINLVNACGSVQSFMACTDLTIKGITIKSASIGKYPGITLSACDGVNLISSYFETSGIDIASDGTSKNIRLTGCKNRQGKNLTQVLK